MRRRGPIFWCLLAFTLCVCAFLIVPVGMSMLAGVTVNYQSGIESGFTLRWVAQVWEGYRDTIFLSIGIALASNGTYQTALEDYDVDPSPTQSAYENLRTTRTQILALNGLADVLWVTTLALGVTTLLLYAIDDDDPGGGSTGSVTVAPIAGAGMLGGAIAWRVP